MSALQIARNALEIIHLAAGLNSPFDHFPLHQVIWHDIAVDVVRRAVHVAAFARVIRRYSAADRRPLIKAHIQPHMLSERIQHPLKICPGAYIEPVARAGYTHNAHKFIEVFRTHRPHLHVIFNCDAHLAPRPLRQVCKQLVLRAPVQVQAIIETRLMPSKPSGP